MLEGREGEEWRQGESRVGRREGKVDWSEGGREGWEREYILLLSVPKESMYSIILSRHTESLQNIITL